MGVLSQGMLLAAGDATGSALVMPDRPVVPGTPLK
jgi:tRNA-binding EMAP/Myf-like protein